MFRPTLARIPVVVAPLVVALVLPIGCGGGSGAGGNSEEDRGGGDDAGPRDASGGCATESCSSHATCDDSSGSAVCTCQLDAGFEGNGTTCSYNPCLLDNGGCGSPATCTNQNGVASCDCPAGTPGCPPSRIVVPATTGTLQESFDVTINGAGSGDIGTVKIDGNVGTIEISGVSYPVIAYEQIPFPAADETLYQLFSADSTEWIVGWAYCHAGSLNQVWYETNAGTPVTYEMGSGTCTAKSTSTTANVSFPAEQMPLPTLVTGFTMSGQDLDYTGTGPGSMALGDSWDIYPFNTVNCWTGCGTPGWYELHSLLWNGTSGEACFGIYYLVDGMTDQVTLDYVICVPGLDDPTNGGASFTASWTTPG